MKKVIRAIHSLFSMAPMLVIVLVVINLLSAAQPFVNVIFSQKIIDSFLVGSKWKVMIVYALWAMGLNAGILLVKTALTRRQEILLKQFSLSFENKMCIHQMNFSLSDNMSNRVQEARRNIEQAKMRGLQFETLIPRIQQFIQGIFSLLFAFITFIQIFTVSQQAVSYSFWTGPWPLIILLFMSIILAVFSFLLQTKKNHQIAELNKQANAANGSAFAYMQMISDYHFGKEIRLYGLGKYLCSTFEKLWSSSIGYMLLKKLGREKALIPCISAFCNGLLDIGIYGLAIMKAISKEISVGMVVVYINSIRIFTQAILALVSIIGELMIFGELLEPYFTLMDIPEETEEEKIDFPEGPYVIEVKNVSFRYSENDEWILKDISCTFRQGESTAIVGINGSGKSTLIKLICRFFKPQKGCIQLNGIDVQNLSLWKYRSLISAVFQDFSLPALSMGEVIGCQENYISERMNTVIKDVGLEHWMQNKQVTLKTALYKKFDGDGVEISGGEAQKIAIARALYRNGICMILDEPTAALDPRTEAEVYESFHCMTSDKMVIYISHRLSSCRFCRQILVLDQGRVIQEGNHGTLVNQEGMYRTLWQAQAQFYES